MDDAKRYRLTQVSRRQMARHRAGVGPGATVPAALAATKGDVGEAALVLGMNTKGLERRLAFERWRKATGK